MTGSPARASRSLHALCDSIAGGELEAAKSLIDAGTDINAVDELGRQPLYYACAHNHIELARYLLDHGADVNHDYAPRKPTELICAAEANQAAMVKLLLDYGARIDERRTGRAITALQKAAAEGALDAVRVLCAAGADVNRVSRSGDTPLLSAIEGAGSAAVVRELIAHGAEVEKSNNIGQMPLTLACWQDPPNPDILQALIEGGVNVAYYRELLHLIAGKSTDSAAACIGVIANAGAGVNSSNGIGRKPLHVAVQNGCVNNMKVLLSLGADPWARDTQGVDAMALAQQGNHAQAIELLVSLRREQALETKLSIAAQPSTSPSL